MADEYQTGVCSGNWWDSARNRLDSGSSPSSSTLSSIGSFGWPTDMDMKARSSMDSVSVSGSSVVFKDTQKLQAPDSAGGSDSGGASSVLPDPNLQMMGLGLSCQAMDWSQALVLRGGKGESGFRSMLQDDLSSNTNFPQETGMASSSHIQWREKMFSGSCEDSSLNEFKQLNRRFSLDQPQFDSHSSSGDSPVTCQGLPTSLHMDSAVYGSSPTMLQGLLVSDHQAQQLMSYPYAGNYGMNPNEALPSWSKFPQVLRTSPPKQVPSHSQLHFSNSGPYWNASAAATNTVRSGFFPPLQTQIPMPCFEEKHKQNTAEVRDSGTVMKKNGGEPGIKRPRNETTSPLPAFKARKEKMGDRITALQQLVSPFGKTDTASVLSEAIEYIKFLHQQVGVLSTPYMNSGAPIQHQQTSDKSKDPEGPKQDLRSRGLCLVPVSSTFPVGHETTVDFWTPTFGGTFR